MSILTPRGGNCGRSVTAGCRDVLYTNDDLLPWLRRSVDRPRSLLRRIELPSLSRRFDHALAHGGVTAAIEAYRAYRQSRTGRFTELEVNALGYAHLQAGRIEEAIANYRKSLELNPANTNAIEMIRRLGGL